MPTISEKEAAIAKQQAVLASMFEDLQADEIREQAKIEEDDVTQGEWMDANIKAGEAPKPLSKRVESGEATIATENLPETDPEVSAETEAYYNRLHEELGNANKTVDGFARAVANALGEKGIGRPAVDPQYRKEYRAKVMKEMDIRNLAPEDQWKLDTPGQISLRFPNSPEMRNGPARIRERPAELRFKMGEDMDE